eukprot:2846074-Alexandrium_andersonii.AAC.1
MVFRVSVVGRCAARRVPACSNKCGFWLARVESASACRIQTGASDVAPPVRGSRQLCGTVLAVAKRSRGAESGERAF